MRLPRLIIRVTPFFEPSCRLSGDPILGFGLALEPANVLSLAARMPCEHIPFIPQLEGLRDYRRGRPGHRGVTALASFVGGGMRDHAARVFARSPEHLGWALLRQKLIANWPANHVQTRTPLEG
jgi:hypothetical protein